MNKYQSFILIISTVILLASCKKSEGEGGRSTIKGKVFVVEMDSKFKDTISTYYSGKEDVYIIYGEEEFYGDKIETHHDGTYQFDYLQNGKYKIYCYSEDTSGSNQLLPIIKEIEITDKKQIIEVSEIKIVK